MTEPGASDFEAIADRLRALTAAGSIRVTQHAQQEMIEENITLEEVLQAVDTGRVLESYAEHRRGACCLLSGVTHKRRPLHIVCTTAQPVLIIITVYEPTPPHWLTPSQRGSES
jgi:hypothetical protein